MKNRILNAVNSLLQPLGVEIAQKGTDLSMNSMLQRHAQRGVPVQTVIDIGASDGKWSAASMKHFPSASFLAIEPLEERKETLENTKSRFTKFDYALCVAGDIDGAEINLNVTPDLDGSTIEGQNPGSSRTCRVRTIDSLVVERNLSGPYLLKFDTHGYELPILSGANDVLANTTAIIMETYNFQLTPTSLRFHEMCAHLEELGFRPVDIAEPLLRLHDKAFWQFDILFIKTDSDVFQYQHYQ